MKLCEICKVEIPEDFANLLCIKHYEEVQNRPPASSSEPPRPEMEIGLDGVSSEPKGIVVDEIEVIDAVPRRLEKNLTKLADLRGKNGVWDETYKENPQMDDKPQWEANIIQFAKSHILLWNAQKQMYTFIKNYIMRSVMEHPQYPKYIWKAKVVDVGSGIGVGTNIVSQEADYIWGIDKNEMSVLFAQQAFTREKNNTYYSSQEDFEHFDIMEDTRETIKFDVVICIEIIEHIDDYKKFLTNIINKFTKKDKNGNYAIEDGPTLFFISTPNRNHSGIKKDIPNNIYHVREWTSQEAYAIMTEYFENVEMFKADGVAIPVDTNHTPILYKCSIPKI